jgi:hypothetical protein
MAKLRFRLALQKQDDQIEIVTQWRQVLAIAKKIEEQDSAGRGRTHSHMKPEPAEPHFACGTGPSFGRMDSGQILSPQSQSDFEIPSHRDPKTESAGVSLEIPQPSVSQFQIVSLSDVQMEQSRRGSCARAIDPDPGFFLQNWVGIVSPTEGEGGPVPDQKSYHLVPELDSPEDHSQVSLIVFDAPLGQR